MLSTGSHEWKVALDKELAICLQLEHENLLPVEWVCTDEVHNLLCVAMPFMPLALNDVLENSPARLAPWPVRAKVARGIAEALQYLHTQLLIGLMFARLCLHLVAGYALFEYTDRTIQRVE